METTMFIVVYSILILTFCKNVQAEAETDVELASPYVTQISKFAVESLAQDERFGLQGASLLMVLDVRRISEGPNSYILTLEMGDECISEECQPSKICEVHFVDAKDSAHVLEDKTRCVLKETRAITGLSGGHIATKLTLDDADTLNLIENAVKQIAEKTEEEVSLQRVVRARQAWDGPSKLYYLTLNVESKKADESPTNEVCDVSIEEGPAIADNTINKQTLRSLHCFTSSEIDSKSSDDDIFFQDQVEEIPTVQLLELVETAHSFISADSTSNFQSKLIGYSLVSNRVSPDSGVKEILLKLGLAPTVCLKSPSNDDTRNVKSCNVDTDRDAAICSLTATQWPWLEGSYLFSDLSCGTATLRTIDEQLTPITKDEIPTSVSKLQSAPSADGVEETTFGSSSAFCTGCERDVSTDSEKIKKLAQFALSAVDDSVNSLKAQGIVKIVKATQQVVSGIKYRLTLAVADTDCDKTSSDRSSCSVNSESPVHHCKVAIIEQAWKNRLEILEITCEPAANPTGENRDSRLLGGVKDASANSADVLEMAQFTLDTLDAFDENDKKRMLVKVLESKKQVVAGTLYTMKLQFSTSDCAESSSVCQGSENSKAFICDVQVLSQPWQATSRKLLQSKCAPAGEKSPRAVPLESEDPATTTSQPEVEKPFEKVNVPRLGGTIPVDPNSDFAKRFAQHAVTAIEERSNSEAKLKLVNIRSSSVQNVAGRLISLSVVVGSTNCKRHDSVQIDFCELNPRGDLQLCTVDIWERAWLNEIQVKHLSCQPEPQKVDDLAVAASALSEDFDESPFVGEVPASFEVEGVRLSPRQRIPGLVGGYKPVDVSDPQVVEMTEFSKDAISNAVNAKDGVQIVKIESAETQVVAGTNYRLKLAVTAGEEQHSCEVVVFDQPWTRTRKVTKISCAPVVNDPDQSVAGFTRDDPSNPKIQEIVAFSLPAIANGFNGGKSVDLIRVESAESQVVSGVNYRVKLTVQAEKNRYSCNAVVFDQPWIQLNQLTFLSCVPLIAQLRGGSFKPRDPNDPKVQEMAIFSLQTVAQEINDGNSVELIEVKSAETQLVSGLNYMMKIVVGAGDQRHECDVVVWDQPWTKTRKVSSSTCIPMVTKSVVPEDPTAMDTLRGQYEPRDPNDAKVQQMAVFSLSAIRQEINAKSPVDSIRVLSAESQIVAGENYKMKLAVGAGRTQHTCQVVVFDQPWTGTRKVSSLSCVSDAAKTTTTQVKTTRKNVRGAYTQRDPNEPRIQKMADFSLAAVGQAINSNDPVELVRVEQAETQVVSGTNYKMKLVVRSGQDQHSCQVVVWDQPWTKTRQVSSVSCVPLTNAPNRERLTSQPGKPSGGYSPVSVTDPDVQEIAAFSLSAIAEGVNGDEPVQLVQIESAQTQVVAGTNYKLKLVVAADDSRHSCEVVVFDQPWTATRKVTSLSCVPSGAAGSRTESTVVATLGSSGSSTESEDTVSSTGSPSTPGRQLLGGYSPQDPNSPDIKEMAAFSLSAISKGVNGGKPVQLVRVEEAATQIVAGVNYKLKLTVSAEENQLTCKVVIFDQSWTGTREVTELSCSPKSVSRTPQALSSSRTERQIVGGYSPADPSSPEVQDVATFSLSAISKGVNGGKPVQLIRVEEAATQIVAGVNYKLKLAVSAEKNQLTCNVVIFDQSWTGTREVTELSCVPRSVSRTLEASFPSRVARQIVGGYSPADPSSPEVQEMATFSLSAISKGVNGGKPVQLVRVEEVATQIVAGVNYKLKLAVSAEKNQLTCNVVIFDQSWTGTREVTELSCSPKGVSRTLDELSSARTGRQIVGGYSPADPSSSEVQEMATFSLSAISKGVNGGKPVQLVRVEEAATQIVAGVSYKLKLAVSAEKNQLTCNVVIFDQSWTGTREVTELSCVPKSVSRTPEAASPSRVEKQTLDGYSPADPSNPEVQDVATFLLPAISKAVNGGETVQLVQVDEAATQIVPGINYKLKLVVGANENQLACNVYLLDQPWTRTRDKLELLCNPLSTVDGSINERPSPGGYFPADPDDPKVQEIATFSLSTISSGLNADKPLRLVKVEEAATDIHAGIRYSLKLIVAIDDNSLTCDVVVLDLPWAGTRKVFKATCVPFAAVRGRRLARSAPLGGWTDVDVSSNKIHEIANFSLGILNERSNEHNLLKFTRILKAQRQKVAGLNYKIDLEVASVACSKNADTESCLVDPSRELQVCSITVWDRPWLNQREVTDLSCKAKRKLTKVKLFRDKNVRRQIVGAPSAVDPNTPEMQEYAALALQALNARSNELNQLKMVRIKDAAVQVVAGKNVILRMEVGPTTCKKGETGACPLNRAAPSQLCAVKVWDRPWLNDRRVTDVSCNVSSTSAGRQNRVERSVSTSPKQKRLKYMNAFRSFMAKHKKVYKNWEEFERRYKIYRENQKKIKELRENELGTAIYGDTPFADLTEDEFKRFYTGLNPALRHPGAKPLTKAVTPDIPLPEEFDWRTKNAVTPVKNQGQCGSCWAFSVTGNVEGQYAIKNGNLLSFSEQELVDCDKLDNGCNGGLPENAYKAIEELGGLELEEDYPYDGHDDKCHLVQNKTEVQVTGGVEISQNETEMAQWLIQNGPISIGINANGMQFYRGGISHPWKFLCRPGGIDHGVLIIGYGVSKYPNFNKTLPYWVIKNSWGTGWGEQGYYRIYRGDGSCGVNMMATSATIA